MNKKEIIYINNQNIGIFKEDKIHQLNKDENDSYFTSLKNNLDLLEKKRRIFSFIVGLFMLSFAILFMILLILKKITIFNGGWFNYPYLLAFLFLVWFLLYFLLGLIFYPKIQLDFYFKDENEAKFYASSKYQKWIDKYKIPFTNADFYLKNKKKNEGIGKGMASINKFSFIYNGKISTNINYFYLVYKGIRLSFLPGFIIYNNKGKNTIIKNIDLKIKKEGNNFTLSYENKTLLSFNTFNEFDLNFFYFKY